MNKKSILFCIVVLMKILFFNNAFAVTADFNSTTRTDLLNATYGNNDVDSVEIYFYKAKESKEARNFPEAISYYKKALQIAKDKGDQLSIASIHYDLGAIYLELKNYSLAILEFESCNSYKEKVKWPDIYAKVAFNLGNIYADFKNYELALTHYAEAFGDFKVLGELSAAGEVLDSIGGIYYQQGNHPGALDSYLSALEFKRKVNSNKLVADLLIKIGSLYLELNENVLASKYFEQSLVLTADKSHKEEEIYNQLGRSYFNRGKYLIARENFETAKEIAEKDGNRMELSEVYKNLAITNEKLNNRSAELVNFRKYIALKDSLLAEENKKRIDEIKAEFEVKNKEKNN